MRRPPVAPPTLPYTATAHLANIQHPMHPLTSPFQPPTYRLRLLRWPPSRPQPPPFPLPTG